VAASHQKSTKDNKILNYKTQSAIDFDTTQSSGATSLHWCNQLQLKICQNFGLLH